jgi:hypothetical protein
MLLLAATALVVAACSSLSGRSANTLMTTPPSHRSTTTSTPGSTTTLPAQPALEGGATPVPVPSGPSVAPPITIAADCSTDVSAPLRKWFRTLGPDTTVVMRPGACYLVDKGITLKEPQGLTVYGGQFRTAVVPSDMSGVPPSDKGDPVFTVIGGSHVTLESMQISGVNPGGYDASLAFAGGIEFEGTSGGLVHGVTISHTFGGGITLGPLRGGPRHNSGTIIGPSTNITIDGVTVDGAGRQGLTFGSVSGAQVYDVILENIGIDTFDFEADQTNEGASDVVIDGCRASGGAIFFANGGAGDAAQTHDITVEQCTMSMPQGAAAILVQRYKGGKKGKEGKLRGPFLFESDELQCGVSVYLACLQLTGADVTVSHSQLLFPAGRFHEAVYSLKGASSAAFVEDIVKGYGRLGHASSRSSVHVQGGEWTAAGRNVNS